MAMTTTFSQALRHMKKGRIAYRQSTPNEWVGLHPALNRAGLKHGFMNPVFNYVLESGEIEAQPFFVLKKENGNLVMGWTPTADDMLAEDWMIGAGYMVCGGAVPSEESK